MNVTKTYRRIYFFSDFIKKFFEKFQSASNAQEAIESRQILYIKIQDQDEAIEYDEFNEFLIGCDTILSKYLKTNELIGKNFSIHLNCTRFAGCTCSLVFYMSDFINNHGHGQSDFYTSISISLPDRQKINDLFLMANNTSEQRKVFIKRNKKIFLGHGRNLMWRDLKDHLKDKHSYDVEAYETGIRYSDSIKNILESLLNENALAIIVMTGEDEQTNGAINPRLNVVHEAGLFQGKLGFSKTILLLEEGTTEFSNIAGIHQIRFSKGNIKEAFGDVVAAINREFN